MFLFFELSNSGSPSQSGSSKEEENLRDNLEAEREAVMDFLFTIVDRVCSYRPSLTEKMYPSGQLGV
jgi:hypothetical protein